MDAIPHVSTSAPSSPEALRLGAPAKIEGMKYTPLVERSTSLFGLT